MEEKKVFATASHSLSVVYEVVKGPAHVEGQTIVITGPGKVILRGKQNQFNGHYEAAKLWDTEYDRHLRALMANPVYLAETRDLFNSAVRAQRYEEAAQYRDKIKRIEELMARKQAKKRK